MNFSREKEENHDGFPHGSGGLPFRVGDRKIEFQPQFSEVAWLSFALFLVEEFVLNGLL